MRLLADSGGDYGPREGPTFPLWLRALAAGLVGLAFGALVGFAVARGGW